jgi:hypothetical protein
VHECGGQGGGAPAEAALLDAPGERPGPPTASWLPGGHEKKRRARESRLGIRWRTPAQRARAGPQEWRPPQPAPLKGASLIAIVEGQGIGPSVDEAVLRLVAPAAARTQKAAGGRLPHRRRTRHSERLLYERTRPPAERPEAATEAVRSQKRPRSSQGRQAASRASPAVGVAA